MDDKRAGFLAQNAQMGRQLKGNACLTGLDALIGKIQD